MKLRPYQQESIDSTLAAYSEGCKSALIVVSTGLGKTITFAKLAERFLPKGRVMAIAHREELVEQGKSKLQQVTNVPVEIEMAERTSDEHGFFGDKPPIVMASVQTLSRGRMKRFDPNEFSLLIIDEAHHAPAATYLDVMRYFAQNDDLKIFGCTATPDRADEEALGRVFEQCTYEYEIRPAIKDGWLVPIRRTAVNLEGVDFSHIKTLAGELNQMQLEAEMIKHEALHGVADATIKEAGDRPTLCFTVSVAQAQKLCEIFNRHRDGSAAFVCGATPKDARRKIVAAFHAGEIQYLCNVGVFTEGFDAPATACISMARPTKSRALYTQIIGRGTRPLPGMVDGYDSAEQRISNIANSGKPNLLVLDFTDNSHRMDIVTLVDVLGTEFEPELLKYIEEEMTDGELDFEEAAEIAEEKRKQEEERKKLEREQQEEEERLRRERESKWKKVKGKATYAIGEIDTANPMSMLGVKHQADRGWNKDKEISEKQRAFLERQGINPDEHSYTDNKRMIGEVMKRWDKGLASMKQVKLLAKYKVDARQMDQKAASRVIDRIAKNKWRPPRDLASLVESAGGTFAG